MRSYFYYFFVAIFFKIFFIFLFFLPVSFLVLISNLQYGINVHLPRALDGALNAIIPSELLFLDVEAIVAEIVQWDSINTSVFEIVKIISIIQSIIDITFNLTRISLFCPLY